MSSTTLAPNSIRIQTPTARSHMSETVNAIVVKPILAGTGSIALAVI